MMLKTSRILPGLSCGCCAAEKATQEVLVKSRGFVLEALRWLIRDGVAVALDVQTCCDRPGVMKLVSEIVEPDRTRQEFQFTDVLGDA